MREEREQTGKWAERGRQQVASFSFFIFSFSFEWLRFNIFHPTATKNLRHGTSLGTIEFLCLSSKKLVIIGNLYLMKWDGSAKKQSEHIWPCTDNTGEFPFYCGHRLMLTTAENKGYVALYTFWWRELNCRKKLQLHSLLGCCLIFQPIIGEITLSYGCISYSHALWRPTSTVTIWCGCIYSYFWLALLAPTIDPFSYSENWIKILLVFVK